ncbi:unnamed protein product, partial [Iphiclides podalirius]
MRSSESDCTSMAIMSSNKVLAHRYNAVGYARVPFARSLGVSRGLFVRDGQLSRRDSTGSAEALSMTAARRRPTAGRLSAPEERGPTREGGAPEPPSANNGFGAE